MENVVTHMEYRNRGYASALLEKASKIAREQLEFYRKNGFVIDEKHSCLKRLKDQDYRNIQNLIIWGENYEGTGINCLSESGGRKAAL
ncbi:MAG: GNAT family N-acetyltransferase [Acetatifactor sp.]|nr:GNAT family N-acetyltransferase [Acetatifactor sp.]